MEGTFLFLACLVPVLSIGAVLVDLLLRDAPRRGKRPDLGIPRPERLPTPGRTVWAVASDGRRLVGTARSVARQMGLRVWTEREAVAGLERLVGAGQLIGWARNHDTAAEPIPDARLRH